MDNISKFPEIRTIEAEACAWIAQLDGGEPSPEDLAAFREWVNRSPRHQEEIRRLSELWADLNVLTELAAPPKVRDKKLSLGMPAWAAAVVLSVVLAGVWFQLRPGAVQMPQFYSAAVGEQELIELPDGSSIQLNTASQIKVDYSEAMREVRLLQGEAFFDVASNPARPFLVYAGENVVRAVGTAFTVQVKQEKVEVLVTEGVVELASVPTQARSDRLLTSTPTRPLASIKVGQRATFGREIESIQSVKREEITRRLSWREGMLVFSGEPLEKVVEEVNRYTSVAIVISDPAIARIRIGGYFKAGETAAMLQALETGFGIRVEHVSEKEIRLSAASS
jgi:transmembrane sensor